MVTQQHVREIALAYPSTEELPHFEITSFRVSKKVFLTMNGEKGHITVRLSPTGQSIFCQYQPEIVYPVASGWGKHGWTHVNLQLVEEELLREIIRISYCQCAPKKLAAKYQVDPDSEAL